MAVTEIVRQTKDNSSCWIITEHIRAEKFACQTVYAVHSVSESQMDSVYQYIRNQKEHHKKKTFYQESENLHL